MSYTKAIMEKCKDCNYDPLDKGSWIKQVYICTDSKCPLYPYRLSKTKMKDAKNRYGT